MVTRHAIALNPSLSVRTERYSVLEGKTPEITVKQARTLLQSIDTTNVVGLRDKSIISILIYTAARIGLSPNSRSKTSMIQAINIVSTSSTRAANLVRYPSETIFSAYFSNTSAPPIPYSVKITIVRYSRHQIVEPKI